jgi:hypothetical protein
MNKQNVQISSRGELQNRSEMKQTTRYRIFLLSPAYAGGRRARMILSDRAEFELARKLRGQKGAPIAEVFTFLSGLYFRGKIAYATAFSRPARGTPGVFVITPTRGLVDARTRIHLDDLREFATVNIHEDDSRYRLPIERDAQCLAKNLPLEKRGHSSRQHCHGQVCGCFTGEFSQSAAIPIGVYWPWRHEPWRIDVALCRGSS